MTAIMIMAGGTGGHVYPALAVAEALREDQHEVSWLGTRAGLEASIVPRAQIPIDWVRISGLRGHGIGAWLLAPFRLLAAVCQAYRLMRRRNPAVVLGMGGFVSAPGGVAAWLQRRPLVVHEQNAVAGLANRILAPLADQVLEAFPGSFAARYRAVHVGNPVRRSITRLAPPRQRFAGRRGAWNLLVLGGSQGALALNRTVPQALSQMDIALRPQVWHQAGRTYDQAAAAYAASGVEARLVEYINDMDEAYAWADLAICRAGALTVAELTAVGLGALLVPYPLSIDDHQSLNAAFLERAGGGRTIPQDQLNPARLAEELSKLGSDRTALLYMAEAAREVAQPNATVAVVAALLAAGGVHD